MEDWYDVSIMETISYDIQNDISLLIDILNNAKQINDFNYAFISNVNNIELYIKICKENKIENDIYISKIINKYYNKLPNFIYFFDYINISKNVDSDINPIFEDKNIMITNYLDHPTLWNLEHGENKYNEKKYNGENFKYLLECVLQVLMIIDYLNKDINFIHNDLHDANIIVEQLDSFYNLKIGNYDIITDKICILFDFEDSFLDNESYTSNIYKDIYFLLVSTFARRFSTNLNKMLEWFGFRLFKEKEFNLKFSAKLFKVLYENNLENIKYIDKNKNIANFINFCSNTFNVDCRRKNVYPKFTHLPKRL